MPPDHGSAIESQVHSIYMDLLAALATSSASGNPVKFEILLESHSLPPGIHVVVEDDTIGIPKKSLRKAYLVARQVFFNEFEQPEPDSETILAASAVLLLHEPEHLTAANARKRILLRSETLSTSEAKAELWLLDSLFQSPLDRHTKSPTLWGHRRWLMRRLPKFQLSETKREITEVILAAAQIHPRNFYAWDYMRWWVSRYPELLSSLDEDVSSSPGSIVEGYLVKQIYRWCLMNTRDTSGWSFLLWLLTSNNQDKNATTSVARRVFDTAVTLKLRNESLWFFLRSLMTSEHMTLDLRQEYLTEIESIATSEVDKTGTFRKLCGNNVLEGT